VIRPKPAFEYRVCVAGGESRPRFTVFARSRDYASVCCGFVMPDLSLSVVKGVLPPHLDPVIRASAVGSECEGTPTALRRWARARAQAAARTDAQRAG